MRGAVTIKDADGAEYQIRLDFNALADWEGAGVGIDNAMTALQAPDKLNARQLRALVLCGLRQCDPDVTEEEAGRLANVETLNAAFSAATPDAGEDVGNARPNRAARRASKAS